MFEKAFHCSFISSISTCGVRAHLQFDEVARPLAAALPVPAAELQLLGDLVAQRLVERHLHARERWRVYLYETRRVQCHVSSRVVEEAAPLNEMQAGTRTNE